MNPVQEEASSKVKNVNAEPLTKLAGRKETVAHSLLVRYYITAREITRVWTPPGTAGDWPELPWAEVVVSAARPCFASAADAGRWPSGRDQWNRVKSRCDWKFSEIRLSFPKP